MVSLRRWIAKAGLAAILFGSTPGFAESDVMDFSDVTTREQAEQLAADGRLVRMLLFPAELGGEDIPQNVAYVPPATLEVGAQLIQTLVGFARDGLIDNLQVVPEYGGASFVPVRIRYHATHSSRFGEFDPVIEIWGSDAGAGVRSPEPPPPS